MSRARTHLSRSSKSGRIVEVHVTSSERLLPKVSSAYILKGGTGQSAYALAQAIERPAHVAKAEQRGKITQKAS